MKLMIVTNNQEFAVALRRYFEHVEGEADVIFVSHEEALGKFLELEPSHVLVCEYEDNADDKKWLGHQTWNDLVDIASPKQVLRRCGFIKNPAQDFIRLPFTITDLKKSFGLS